MKAIWNDTVIAESASTEVVEGNHYFPSESVERAYLKPSPLTTVCGWKGTAQYYDVVVDGQTNPGAAWYYAQPKPAAEEVRGMIAFWKGIRVVE